MSSLGADEVIDYQRDDSTRRGPFDLVLDLVAHRSVFAYRRALGPGAATAAWAGPCGRCCVSLTVGWVVGWSRDGRSACWW